MADSPARLRSVGRFGIEPISLMIRRGSVTIASDASTSTVAVPSPLVRKSRPRPSSTVSPARPSGQVKSMVVVRRTEPARRGGADSTEPPGLRPTGTGIAMRPPSPRPPGMLRAFRPGRNPVPRDAGRHGERQVRPARLRRFYEKTCDSGTVRTAYRCRAYPDEQQQAMLRRTFGCVRVVWNRTLAQRRARWHLERTGTSYAETDRALTAMKKDPDLAFLNQVSSVPLQQALRHQHQAFRGFFAGRARYPRFKSRAGRQSAHYTRCAFSLRSGALRLAKTATPLRFTWSWPGVDVAALDPAMVIVCREPDGRWYVTFTLGTAAPPPLPQTGHAIGIDLGVRRLAVTS